MADKMYNCLQCGKEIEQFGEIHSSYCSTTCAANYLNIQTELHYYKKELEALQTQRTSDASEINSLRARNASLNAELRQQDVQIQKIDADRYSQSSEIARLTNANKELNADIKTLIEYRKRQAAENMELTHLNKERNEELRAQDAERLKHHNRIKELENALYNIATERNSLKKQLEQLKDAHAFFERDLEYMSKKNTEMKQSVLFNLVQRVGKLENNCNCSSNYTRKKEPVVKIEGISERYKLQVQNMLEVLASTIALLTSMVRGKEDHSPTSEKQVEVAFELINKYFENTPKIYKQDLSEWELGS